MSVLRSLSSENLLAKANDLGIDHPNSLRKQDLIFSMMKNLSKRGDILTARGIAEVMPDGFAFLRFPEYNYLTGADDIYIAPSHVRRLGIKTGDDLMCEMRRPKESERYFSAGKILEIHGQKPNTSSRKISFDNSTPLYPDTAIQLEMDNYPDKSMRDTLRIIDIIAPIGKGQRALIVAPPRSGKTVMLQSIAQSIETNHPEVEMMVLLIDERPEEVTDMARTVKSAVFSSTFDEPAHRHIQVADMVIERAKRLVEHKKDVVILLDSITRLARAYNSVTPSSGKVLTGGVDANALQKPKRFFGAARNVENGGSLTILATALLETGSKADDVVFEEFKGTGNSEICLDRRLAQRGTFPAIDIARSGTRKDNLLMPPEVHRKAVILRSVLLNMSGHEGMEFLLSKTRKTKNNKEFYNIMNS
ncbi:MAG: transcription termination factor Rho [Alphaproteobacteria bacterium]|nr:transcription termination factor Rho [Alphaproteobacteria bacterium]